MLWGSDSVYRLGSRSCIAPPNLKPTHHSVAVVCLCVFHICVFSARPYCLAGGHCRHCVYSVNKKEQMLLVLFLNVFGLSEKKLKKVHPISS